MFQLWGNGYIINAKAESSLKDRMTIMEVNEYEEESLCRNQDRKESFANIVNKSVWQTLARSINTTVTTLITLVCLYILGVTSIKQFMLPLLIGVTCGAYSSIFISGQFWVLFKGSKKAQ